MFIDLFYSNIISACNAFITKNFNWAECSAITNANGLFDWKIYNETVPECTCGNEVCWAFFKAGSLLTGASGDARGNNRKQRTAVGDVRWSGTHHTINGQFLDTAGGTSQITYSCRLGAGHNGTCILYLNRHHTDDNYAYDFDTQSTITAIEVKV